ncbi:MAG: Hsp20/alpha crystallin family protein [Nocardioidaceae bacterium]|nr:Hsp20/alpha crystallin family protein [Nocardioidaceae bacterium]
MMLRTDPFRDLDRLTQQVLGTTSRPSAMPMDAWRDQQTLVLELDLPGVETDSIDLDVERNVLTVKAVRPPREHEEYIAEERPRGVFSRRVILGDTLDVDQISATYDDGVLTVRIPVAERAKPRRIHVTRTAGDQEAIPA